MHFFHPTPLDIVDQFISAKTKGKHFERVLDPCVGDGALLTSLENNFDSLTIIDIDSEKLKIFRDSNFIKYEGDFLDIELSEKFDLILCNPPFNNKSISGLSIEEKFLLKCLNLIKNEGYGIFILPSSIINGTKTKKIREFLINNFTLISIDILPKKTFTKIESHFYIITLKNIKTIGNYNIDTNMGIININLILKHKYETLNPKYMISFSKYQTLLNYFPKLFLSKDSLFRGNVEKNNSQLHTTHFSTLFCNKYEKFLENKNGKKIKKYDLLCKRVGRNCHSTFSIYLGNNELIVSDCIIVLPSNSKNLQDNLIRLLNIRLSILLGASDNFMIEGSGANYISLKKLKETDFIDFRNYISKKDIKKYAHLILKSNVKKTILFEETLKNKISKKIHI